MVNNTYEFIIDDNIILYFVIKYSRRKIHYTSNIVIELQNYLYQNRELFETIWQMSIEEFISKDLDSDILNYFSRAINSSEYKALKQVVQREHNTIVKEFNDTFQTIEDFLFSYKIVLDKHIKLYIVPSCFGVSFSISNKVFYGTHYRYPHIINIFHEVLHSYLPDTSLYHAIIELLTNGEFIKLLYGIDSEKIYYDGHWFLSNLKYEIQNEWTEYVNTKNKQSIFDFHDHLMEILDKKEYFYYHSENSENEYLNLSDDVILIQGNKNSLVISDTTKDILHIKNEFTDRISNYVYSNIPFRLDDSNSEFNEIISELQTRNIVKIESKKRNNIRFENIRFSTLNLEVLVVDLTNICNLKCIHCYNKIGDKEITRNDFDIIIFKKVLKQARYYGCTVVNFVGGEPTLVGKDKILEFIQIAYEEEYIRTIHLFTNGLLLDEDYCKAISKFKSKLDIGLTFHGDNAILHDKVSGVNGDFNHKLELIELFNKYDIKYSLSTVYSKYNSVNKEAIIDSLSKLKHPSQNIPISVLARVGNETQDIIDKSMDVNSFVLNPFELLKKKLPDFSIILVGREQHPCFATHIALSSDYNVYACAELHLPETYIANLKDYDYNIHKLVNSNSFYEAITKKVREEKCEICEFKPLCFSCYTLIKGKSHYGLNSFCAYNPSTGNLLK